MPARSSPKVRPDHLERPAFVYVRQSTLFQVRENTASTARQYDLVRAPRTWAGRARRSMSSPKTQGRSGSSAVDRDGFHPDRLCRAWSGQRRPQTEASRLARSCSDWYRLLEICALTDTLVIDEDGVYDPCQYQDRLLLGILGAMSEAELHWLRSRLLGGKLVRAEQGELRILCLPVGLVFDAARRLVLDPRRGGAAGRGCCSCSVRSNRLKAGGRQALCRTPSPLPGPPLGQGP